MTLPRESEERSISRSVDLVSRFFDMSRYLTIGFLALAGSALSRANSPPTNVMADFDPTKVRKLISFAHEDSREVILNLETPELPSV